MTTRSNIKELFKTYSAKNIWETLNSLINYVRKSIENTGNSFYKIFLIIFLLVLIGIKKIGLFIKNISEKIVIIIKTIRNFIVTIWQNFIKFVKYAFNNFLKLLNLIWKFIKKTFFLTVVEEIGFYFKKLKDFSGKLKENLSIIARKLQDYSNYLSQKFNDNTLEYYSSITETYLSLTGNTIVWFVISITWFVVSILMSIILISGTIIGIPVLHQFVRKIIIGNEE